MRAIQVQLTQMIWMCCNTILKRGEILKMLLLKDSTSLSWLHSVVAGAHI